MKAVKLCRDCGRPIKNGSSRRVVCDDCLRKKGAIRQEEVRSLESEDEARRAAAPNRARRKSPSRAWTSACEKLPPWASATASMWSGGWISREELESLIPDYSIVPCCELYEMGKGPNVG